MDENDVTITRNKKLLEEIRNGDTNGSGGHSGDREESSSGDQERMEGGPGTIAQPATRTGESSGTPQGLHTRARQAKQPDVNAAKSPRQRKPKESDRVTEEKPKTRLRLPFLEKGQTKATPVRLFSMEEAEAEQDRMAEIYAKLFDFGDDVLEIIVRDHEPVEIWHINEEQAETLARNHLTQARTNVEAARSARKLLEVYDRLYFYSVVIPRVVKTSNHIAEHKGLSFK